MRRLPLFVDLRGKLVVVIGGGKVARRKIATLLNHGAKIRVYEPNPSRELLSLVEKGVEVVRKKIGISDAEEIASCAHMVIVATDDVKLNREIGEVLRDKGILLNVITSQDVSTAVFPAILRLGDVVIAIGTNGLSPFLASHIRDKVREALGSEIGAVAEVLAHVRSELKKMAVPMKVKKAIYEALLRDNEVMSLILQGLKERAKEKAMEKSLEYLKEHASTA